MQSHKSSKMVAKPYFDLFLHFNLTRYVWMLFFVVWFIILFNCNFIFNDFDYNVSIDNIILNEWINVVNLDKFLSEHLKCEGRCLIKDKAQVKPWLAEPYINFGHRKKSVLAGKIILGYVSSRLCPFRFESLLGCVHSGLRSSTGRPIETLPQSV